MTLREKLRPRAREYLVITLLGIIVGLSTTLVGTDYGLKPVENVTIFLVSEILLMDIAAYITSRPPRRSSAVQVLRGEAKVFKKAEKMQKNVKSSVYAIWCIMRYSESLERYFDKVMATTFRDEDAKLYRCINVKEIGANRVEAHLIKHLEDLKSGRYIIYSTNHKAFECLVVDQALAMILAPHAVQEILYMGLYVDDEHFVGCMIEQFNDLRKEENMLICPAQGTDSELEQCVKEWIKKHNA